MLSKIKLPMLLLVAVMIILAMLRLAVWQLDRAQQKAQILSQQRQQAAQATLPLAHYLAELEDRSTQLDKLRFSAVEVEGEFLAEATIFIDNRVHGGKVGYQVITPLRIKGLDSSILVDRGWVAIGASRDQVPVIHTPNNRLKLRGRFNSAPAQPPLWDEKYAVSQGSVWAYLPMQDYATQFQLKTLPLVLELAPDSAQSDDLVIAWDQIDDKWVAKHKAYAFQWFAMALVFFVACLILLLKRGVKASS